MKALAIIDAAVLGEIVLEVVIGFLNVADLILVVDEIAGNVSSDHGSKRNRPQTQGPSSSMRR